MTMQSDIASIVSHYNAEVAKVNRAFKDVEIAAKRLRSEMAGLPAAVTLRLDDLVKTEETWAATHPFAYAGILIGIGAGFMLLGSHL